MTDTEWDEANTEWNTAEAVFFHARTYHEKGWLSDAGFEHACRIYEKASAAFDAASAAYYSEDAGPCPLRAWYDTSAELE